MIKHNYIDLHTTRRRKKKTKAPLHFHTHNSDLYLYVCACIYTTSTPPPPTIPDGGGQVRGRKTMKLYRFTHKQKKEAQNKSKPTLPLPPSQVCQHIQLAAAGGTTRTKQSRARPASTVPGSPATCAGGCRGRAHTWGRAWQRTCSSADSQVPGPAPRSTGSTFSPLWPPSACAVLEIVLHITA